MASHDNSVRDRPTLAIADEVLSYYASNLWSDSCDDQFLLTCGTIRISADLITERFRSTPVSDILAEISFKNSSTNYSIADLCNSETTWTDSECRFLPVTTSNQATGHIYASFSDPDQKMRPHIRRQNTSTNETIYNSTAVMTRLTFLYNNPFDKRLFRGFLKPFNLNLFGSNTGNGEVNKFIGVPNISFMLEENLDCYRLFLTKSTEPENSTPICEHEVQEETNKSSNGNGRDRISNILGSPELLMDMSDLPSDILDKMALYLAAGVQWDDQMFDRRGIRADNSWDGSDTRYCPKLPAFTAGEYEGDQFFRINSHIYKSDSAYTSCFHSPASSYQSTLSNCLSGATSNSLMSEDNDMESQFILDEFWKNPSHSETIISHRHGNLSLHGDWPRQSGGADPCSSSQGVEPQFARINSQVDKPDIPTNHQENCRLESAPCHPVHRAMSSCEERIITDQILVHNSYGNDQNIENQYCSFDFFPCYTEGVATFTDASAFTATSWVNVISSAQKQQTGAVLSQNQACFSSISPTMDTHPISLESDLFHKHSAGRQIYEVSDYQPTILQTLSPPVSGPLLAVPAVPQQHAWVSGTFQPPVMVHPIQQVIQRNSLFQTAVQPIARPKQHNQMFTQPQRPYEHLMRSMQPVMKHRHQLTYNQFLSNSSSDHARFPQCQPNRNVLMPTGNPYCGASNSHVSTYPDKKEQIRSALEHMKTQSTRSYLSRQ